MTRAQRRTEASFIGMSSDLPSQIDSERERDASPRAIVEALLFVGDEQNRAISSKQIAAIIGGVGPTEVETLVDELNAAYAKRGAAYRIATHAGGYTMELLDQHERVRQRFHGKIREARLSPTAIDVLAIVAYRQPIRGDEVDELRQNKSSAILAQLVRRRLLQIERPEDDPHRPFYRTTDRFLRVFGLATLNDLPSPDRLERGAE